MFPQMPPNIAETHHSLNRWQIAYVWMAALFLTSLIVANLIGSMLFSFEMPWLTPMGDHKVLLSSGIICFPLTFILTDLVNEFYGKPGAKLLTWMGFGMSLLVYICFAIGERLPVDPMSQITHGQFVHLSHPYTQLFIASILAYLLGQFLDIHIFHIFRAFTKHRFIWFRATGSTVVSQLFDSFIFTFIAFWGNYSWPILWRIAYSNYLWKLVVVIAVTPLLYAGHQGIKRYIGRKPIEPIKPKTDREKLEQAFQLS